MSTLSENLGLVKPESGDNVDLSVINENYDILDDEIHALKKDPIVDRKTINGWEVYYYNSGEVECYKKINTGSINATSGACGMNRSVLMTENLPVTMLTPPMVFLSATIKDVANKLTTAMLSAITNTNFSYYVLVNGSQKNKVFEVNALVKGRWK